MFNNTINARLKLLDFNVVKQSETEMILEETKFDGYAKLKCKLNHPTIAFFNLEDKKLGYFVCQSCADKFMLSKLDDDSWVLHIIEFKRTVRIGNWESIKKQFLGAILHAMALSGFLGFKLDLKQANLYTGFRNDKVYDTSPIEMKVPSGISAKTNSYLEWKEDIVEIEIDNKYKLNHSKIKLDESSGYAELKI